jgi:hypothetical protein
MYVYITCHPDIGYAITSLSKFSSAPSPSPSHCKLLKGVAKYLRTTMHWGIQYKQPKRLPHLPAGEPYSELQDDPKQPFPAGINRPLLQCLSMPLMEMISTNEDQLLVLSSLIVVVLFYIDLKLKL